MPDLREEIGDAFPGSPAPTEDQRLLAPSMKAMSPEDFLAQLPTFMLASIDQPMEGDPITAILISQVPKRAEQIRTLTPAQRRVIAKFIATTAGDHELRKGSLLAALEALML
jgi:hypothetical protein